MPAMVGRIEMENQNLMTILIHNHIIYMRNWYEILIIEVIIVNKFKKLPVYL